MKTGGLFSVFCKCRKPSHFRRANSHVWKIIGLAQGERAFASSGMWLIHLTSPRAVNIGGAVGSSKNEAAPDRRRRMGSWDPHDGSQQKRLAIGESAWFRLLIQFGLAGWVEQGQSEGLENFGHPGTGADKERAPEISADRPTAVS
jgi:hypothetical protein